MDEGSDHSSRNRVSSASEVGTSVRGEISLFSDDNSFERMYGEEEQFEIIAPSGKLGVVIDTPYNGGNVPVVHAIKDTSILADRVRIGDKLLSVDGQDTRNMSAIKVSKLISAKAMEPQRRLVFLRPGTE
jgi:C-terminal processing protease CtpA/Prc